MSQQRRSPLPTGPSVRNGRPLCVRGATRTLQLGSVRTASARAVNPLRIRSNDLSYAKVASFRVRQEARVRVQLSITAPIEGSGLLVVTEGQMPTSVCGKVRLTAESLLGPKREMETVTCKGINAEYGFSRMRTWTMATKKREFTITRPTETQGWAVVLPKYADDEKKAKHDKMLMEAEADRRWDFRLDRAKFLYNRVVNGEDGELGDALEEEKEPKKKKPLPRPAVTISMAVLKEDKAREHRPQSLHGGGAPSKRSRAAKIGFGKKKTTDPVQPTVSAPTEEAKEDVPVEEGNMTVDAERSQAILFTPGEDYDEEKRDVWRSATLDETVGTFAPGMWLSDTAIVRYLMMEVCKIWRFIIIVTVVSTRIPLPPDQFFKVTFLSKSSFDRVVIPIYVPDHWATSILDIQNHEIVIYDSLPNHSMQYMCHVEKKLQEVAAVLINERFDNGSRPEDIRLLTAPRDRQTTQLDGHSCGIFAIYNSLKYLDTVPQPLQGQTPIADVRLPDDVSPDSLRANYMALLREHLQAEQVSEHIRPLKRRGIRPANPATPAKIPRAEDDAPSTSTTQVAATLSAINLADDASSAVDRPEKKRVSLEGMSEEEKKEHRRKEKCLWRERNREEALQQAALWRAKNRDRVNATQNSQRSQNRADFNQKQSQRRMTQRLSTGKEFCMKIRKHPAI
uniref:ULP_PROTEASE domain-containing protein n=1 Tax=Steinernema glaseri TaxID=37863 RepID=A0A1I7YG33_9BILA